MPQSIQIVPEYTQPYVKVVTNDYTKRAQLTAEVVDDNVKNLCVFVSAEGIDNKLIKVKSQKERRQLFGDDRDFKKYGQPILMPYAALNTTYVTAWCMRVMPENATYSNAILSMKYKFNEDTGKMIIKWVSEYATDCTSKDILDIKSAAAEETEADAEGFFKKPIIVFNVVGRGVYGDDFRFRITKNISYEKKFGIKMFSFLAIRSTTGLETVGEYIGSVVTSPKYTATTMIQDILEDADEGTSYFDITVDEDAIAEIYEKYKAFVEGLGNESLKGEVPDLDCWDPFFGTVVNSETLLKNIEIDTTSEGAISVDKVDGTLLAGGSDGDFADAEKREEAISKCYQNAFNGVYDKQILSARRVPITYMLDAGYDYPTKEALVALCNLRDDCRLYLDAGIVTNIAQIETLFEDYAQFAYRNVSKDFQHYKIKDPVTKKRIPVTMTYFYAQALPNHFKNLGFHIPFVNDNATLYGHVKNSLTPMIDDIDKELKEQLCKHRFNYFEAIGENVFVRGVQNTSQTEESDLLEENNMNTYHVLKRYVTADAQGNLYNFAEAEQRNSFSEYVDAKYADWRNKRLHDFSVKFDMNEFENEYQIVHCYLGMTFRTLNKQTIVEIDINKRELS